MSSASVTAYSFISSLPKDVSGQKFLALVSSDGSVAPFTLPRGIGASAAPNGYLFTSLGVATWTGASPVGVNDPAVGIMGLYTNDHAASKVSSGQAQFIKSTRKGELIVSGACKIPITDATSANIYTLGSGLLYGGYITGAGVTAGDNVSIRANTTTVFNFTFDVANQTIPIIVPAGGVYFSASITHSRNISGGATSVTLFVERS